MEEWEKNKEQIKLDEQNYRKLKDINIEIKYVKDLIKNMEKNLNSSLLSQNSEKNNFLTYKDICELSSENNRQLIAVKSSSKIKSQIKSLEGNKHNNIANFYEFIENINPNEKKGSDINKKNKEMLETNNCSNILMLESLGQPKSAIDLYFIEKNTENHEFNDFYDNSSNIFDQNLYLNELKCRKCSFNSCFSISSINGPFN